MMTPWLAVIGIGEDGVEGLSPQARRLVAQARYVMGGERHIRLARSLIAGEAHIWPHPFSRGVEQVLHWRGEPVVVLASGDPFCFGVGSVLSGRVEVGEMICLPVPSSVALACARLGWAEQDVRVLSLCGRPLSNLIPALQPGQKLLVLSADGATPRQLAAWLTERGFGESWLHVLQTLGGPDEMAHTCHAREGVPDGIAALNLVAVDLVAGRGACVIPRAPGLPDDWFESDGQLTKRDIRAVTLSSLAPRVGEVLWDVGAGSGSVAIEWMLAHPANRAIAIESDPDRVARITRNAVSLGVPSLDIVQGRAPDALDGLAEPDAVFVGGGLTAPGLFERVWACLRPGGRIVANAVTLESEVVLIAQQERHGGTLSRISVERLDHVGRFRAMRPAMTVTQWCAVKETDG
ncbi:precorrin-6y C5,15-methyltransferase (decarboxylating) subunit CbiE [Acetobacter estunensis]|uniref:precorrin-6y C5,15-methyltransferase (decarboxylating) subunit CbiE n=1 Tax=Acetobacter estunensis TaxID=104097 RepID=UPI001C2D1B6A|nr:precorrin-6y C5,15-methyltransferase (decarboxylating) subunit CbiE [Acetobacter estunensis]MBV1837759.1 precorrin-6y C5,15-methyltransferase (decarboxylating) subunit CbiE [Acetobacter estunensis]